MPRTYGHQPTTDCQPGTPPHGPAGASPTTPRTHRLAITATGVGTAEVLLNGQDIANSLQGLTLDMGVGKTPTATLDLLLIDTTRVQDAETRILIPDATRDALLALGWTPPSQDTDPAGGCEHTQPGTPCDWNICRQPASVEGVVDTDPIELTPYLVVQRYRRDHGGHAWVVRCWGDAGCDGYLALDLSDRAYAERKAREHLAAEHPNHQD